MRELGRELRDEEIKIQRHYMRKNKMPIPGHAPADI